jgi:hypothetical protein
LTISAQIAGRGISEVLHFTTNRGIVGILASGIVLSRARLPKQAYLKHVLKLNANQRPEAAVFFDRSRNWLDYVNLSIDEVNSRFFEVSRRWHIDEDVWWGILSFDPIIMTHKGVVFTTTNNGYPLCVREEGLPGLERLFENSIKCKAGWTIVRRNRPDRLPTCEQAEVLYPQQLPITFLRRIYVRDGDHHDQVSGWLLEFQIDGVEVVLAPEKFVGMPNR